MTFSNERDAKAKYSSLVEYGRFKISKILYHDGKVVERYGDEEMTQECTCNEKIYTNYTDGYYQF